MFCPVVPVPHVRDGGPAGSCATCSCSKEGAHRACGVQGHCKPKALALAQQGEDPGLHWPPRALQQDSAAIHSSFRTEALSLRDSCEPVSVHWMEREVVSRLLKLDEKVEHLRQQTVNALLTPAATPAIPANASGTGGLGGGPSLSSWQRSQDPAMQMPPDRCRQDPARSQWSEAVAQAGTRAADTPESMEKPMFNPGKTFLKHAFIKPRDSGRLSMQYREGVQQEESSPERAARGSTASPSRSRPNSVMFSHAISESSERPRSLNAMRNSTVFRLLDTLSSPAPDSQGFARAARCYKAAMPTFIIATVSTALFQAVEPPILEELPADILEATIESIFMLELLLRFVVCPSCSRFFLDPYNVIDLMSVVPLPLRCTTGFKTPTRVGNENDLSRDLLVAVVPVIRLMKSIHWFQSFTLLTKAFRLCFEALPICLFTLWLLTLVFSALIFIVEPRDNISTLPQAMWLTIVTMTTVGYGDVTPRSGLGSCTVVALVVTSVMYMAMPLGIIGQAFQQVWSERDHVLVISRTQDSLRRWGYTATQIPEFFDRFDFDRDGVLNLEEFIGMMTELKAGLTQKRMITLFESFDTDGSGFVDEREFIRILFPASFPQLYGRATKMIG